MVSEKQQLLQTGIELYSLGFEVDDAKEKLEQLVQSRKASEKELTEACQHLQSLIAQWQITEEKHLRIRERLGLSIDRSEK